MEIAQLAVSGDFTARDAWLEFVRVTRGRQSISFSAGLRAEYLAGNERTDAEIAADRSAVGMEPVAEFEVGLWRQLVAFSLHEVIPTAADGDGLAGVERALRAVGIEFTIRAGPDGLPLFSGKPEHRPWVWSGSDRREG